MITLQHIFDSDPQVKDRPTFSSKGGKYEKVKLKTDTKDKNIFIGSSSSLKEKGKFLIVLWEYIDVIACSYKVIKIYDTSVLIYMIPLKLGPNLFKKW